MILRRDHVAGGVFVVAGALVYVFSGDLPLGIAGDAGRRHDAEARPRPDDRLRPRADGAREYEARHSPTIAWSDLPHALCVDRRRRARDRALHHAWLPAHDGAVAVRPRCSRSSAGTLMRALVFSIGVPRWSPICLFGIVAQIAAAARPLRVLVTWKQPSTACCSASRSRSGPTCCSMPSWAAWSARWSACCPASARSPASASCCR